MFRRTTLIWLLVTAALGFGLYQIKYEVQSQEERLARINRQILDNEEAIQVLSAEWSYLNRPDRLAEMARRYLEMSPLTPAQFTQLASLPDRSQVVEAAAAAPANPAQKPLPVKAAPTQPSAPAAAKPAPRLAALPSLPPASHAAEPVAATRPLPAAPKPVATPVPAQPKPMHAAAYSPPESQRELVTLLSAPRVLVASLLQAISEAQPAAAPPSLETPAGPR